MVTDEVPLHDQHCHGVVTADLDAGAFAGWLTEAFRLPPHRDPFDSMLGLAVRRWCAPVLGLPAHAESDAYLRRRAELGWRAVTERLLRSSGVTNWLVDTGFTPPEPLTGPAELAGLGGGAGHEVVRVERVAETIAQQGESPRTLLDAIRAELRGRATGAVALKTVIGYRCGLALPAAAPSDTEARAAAERWLRSGDRRLTEPVLLAWLVYEAARVGAALGLPLQVHTGFGDPDLRLRDVDPALLGGFLEATVDSGVTVVLLHCWPYHRNAAYLAHGYPHVIVDIGLTVPFVGARTGEVLGEILELAPFDAVVYSSDGRALPELHHLGAVLWRHHLGRLLDEWISADVLSTVDAERLAVAVGRGNSARIHPQLT
ncbi:MAG TPA: amidohydrolase family protein [Actinophytocola sp.]|uniref:amidohydrolase family protein n=1 Tax=Actinophytocola sp. TaxID=1872138 RepID=UPI002DDCCAA7|nr:amidohydrolase family protein [Actinophytocola sp.]HEV2781122.1 amidohydrolase family protein [Actinophytocola sp.]